MKQKHIKSLYATLRTKQSKVNKSGLEFAWLKLEMTNVSSWWRQKCAHKKWRGSPTELGIYPPFPLRAGHEGPRTTGMGTCQALKAADGSKIPIRWSVTSNTSHLCLLHRSPETAWFLSPAEILPHSWEVKQAAAAKSSFLFPAAALEASCSDRHLLGHENMYLLLYGTTLLPFQVCVARWDCRHCSRASNFPECAGKTTVSSHLAVFWCEGWGGLKTQTSTPPTASKLSWQMQYSAVLPCRAPRPCLGMDYCTPAGCSHLLNHSHSQLVGWIRLWHKQRKTQWCYSRKGRCSCVHPCPHEVKHTYTGSLEKGLMLSKLNPSEVSVYTPWLGLED